MLSVPVKMFDLPPEVFGQIIGHLRQKDLLALASASKTLYEGIIHRLYHRNCVEDLYALFWCAEHGFANGVRIMLSLGVEADPQGYGDFTPLMLAAKCGIEPLKRLGYASTSLDKAAWDKAVSNGDAIQIHYGGIIGKSFAHHENGYEEVVQVLLDHGADPNFTDVYDDTPFLLAVRGGNAGMAALLLRQDPSRHDMAKRESESLMSMFLDLKDGPRCEPLLKVLLDHGLDIDAPNPWGQSALHIACERGMHPSWVHLFLAYNANPNHRDSSGSTPLHVQGLTLEAASLLLYYGADVNSQNSLGHTPLHCHVHRADLSRLLRQWQADKSKRDVWGRMPKEYKRKQYYLFIREYYLRGREFIQKNRV